MHSSGCSSNHLIHLNHLRLRESRCTSRIPPLVDHNPDTLLDKIAGPMRMPKHPHPHPLQVPARLVHELRGESRLVQVRSRKLWVARPLQCRGMVRHDEDTAVGLLSREPVDFMLVCLAEVIGFESGDALEVRHAPFVNVIIFGVKRSPKRAAEDSE